MFKLTSIILLVTVKSTTAFWPPAYKIHLNQSETFIISDMFDEYDAQDFDPEDEEMIKEADLERFQHMKNSSTYYRIHKIAGRRNRAANDSATPIPVVSNKPTESRYDQLDDAAYAGFVNNQSELETNENVYYANEMAKSTIEKKIKDLRGERRKQKGKEADYDYTAYKKEYADLLKKEEKSKNVLVYTEMPEEESVKDSVKNIIKFKKVKNCTKEEIEGIGVGSMRCFMHDVSHLKQEKNKTSLMKRLFRFCMIWFVVYAAIAIPCWCTKGWCCCCFRCKFCRPREQINSVKKFIADNPLGVLQLDKNKTVTYTPTIYEEHAQKLLEQAIMKL